MSNKNNSTTTAPKQITGMVWMVEPQLTEAKRSADGKWLKRNIDLNAKPVAKFEDALAGRSDYDDSDMLFVARR